jgi:DNA-binding HxlR family transcriptional regulator
VPTPSNPSKTATATPTALRNRYADMRCSLARSLELIGDHWSPLIIRDLSYGPQRFGDLAEDLGVARNLLTSRLERLVKGDIVTRTLYQEHPPRYDYDLSEAGRDLAPILMALTAWGDRWAAPEGGPPLAYRHDNADCQSVFTPTVCCSKCGGAVALHNVDIGQGQGPLVGRGTLLADAFIDRRRTVRRASRPGR